MEITNLKAYLAEIGMTIKEFCEVIECNDKYLSRLIHGKKRAGRRLAKDIYQATSGTIKLKTRPHHQYKKKEQQQSVCL